MKIIDLQEKIELLSIALSPLVKGGLGDFEMYAIRLYIFDNNYSLRPLNPINP